MMNNLFSMFDPSTNYMNMSWMMATIPLMMTSMKIKKMKNKVSIMNSLLVYNISKEMKPILSSSNKKGSILIMSSIFVSIMLVNIMALSPFTFTLMAQVSMAFPMSMIMWSTMMIMGWKNNSKSMMAHCLPTGTPMALMNFMVLIEMVSNMIRPITLSVRMVANMVAGHLLLSLLSNFSISSVTNYYMTMVIVMVLTCLEIAVSIIQSYVFMVLVTLYSTEIH
uniref:ATP synthase F0 subunit 6 n=1 Tax=Halotydeus destructor TaxID=2874060 RepID=UPI0020297D53|nr:ATP synthase F0 subunit 6 [Halotydeus destructor]UPN63255.1 ATP synthase subunit 6 [Halotydeus destructor]